jgi:lysophospholipase L1-like esterase
MIDRIAVVVVLLLAAGCQTVSREQRAAALEKWRKELDQFARADAGAPPTPGGTLFVGSSSFRLWTNLAAAFPERRVINRGFGGSQMHELLALSDRLVTPYQAREILVYEGDNDLANRKSPEQIMREFRAFTREVHRQDPEAHIYFVAIKASPSRIKLQPLAAKANGLIQEYCASKPRLHFIDVYTPMLDAQGQPRADLFVEDELHLNGAGYAIWTRVIRRELGLAERSTD